jgi:3'-5' exoribonuclease
MTKIKNMQNNSTISTSLVLVSSAIKMTKTNKPYLAATFFDGFETINGNFWDWTSGYAPVTNLVYKVSAAVTEWQGTKQLTIQSLLVDNETPLSEFMPKSDYNIEQSYKEIYTLALDIKDDLLRDITLTILDSHMSAWYSIPGAKSIHHAYSGGTLVHSLAVANIAKSICSFTPDANEDLVVAGAILHDVGKLLTYKFDGVTITNTYRGALYDHIYLGARLVEKTAEAFCHGNPEDEMKVIQLIHIILSHHGNREWGAVVSPMTIEAHIVHKADSTNANTETISEFSKKSTDDIWTDKIWSLDNMPHINPKHTQAVMEGE